MRTTTSTNPEPEQLTLPLELQDQSGGASLSPAAQRLLNLHSAWAEVVSATGDLVELVAAALVSQPVAEARGAGPLWLLLIGPPSSGRTEAVTAAKGMARTYYLDTLTENSFVSGYIPTKGMPQDLLKEIGGKVLVVKDLSSFLSLKEDAVKKVLGGLCAIYDGSFAKYTGTRGKVRYEAVFPFIACVTPHAVERHSHYVSIIGPRFLYRLLPRLTPEQKAEGEARDRLNRLADFVAVARASLRYARVGSNYEPGSVQREEPWRALQQLRLLVTALATVHGRSEVTAHELEMARRVVLSTMSEARAQILGLFQEPDALVRGTRRAKGRRYSFYGITCNRAAEVLAKSPSRAKELVRELELVGVIHQAGKSKMGNIVYVPLPEFDDLLRQPVAPLDHPADLIGAATVTPKVAATVQAALHSSPPRGS